MKTPDINLITNCQLVQGLTKDELDRLIAVCEMKQFTKGNILFKEGDTSKNIYVVAEGRLGVRKRIIDKKDDNIPLAPVIAEHGVGEIVGEFSFFDGNPRSAEVFAMIDTWVLILDSEMFHHFTDNFPQVSQKITVNIIKILIGRMRKANQRLSIALEWGWEVHGFAK